MFNLDGSVTFINVTMAHNTVTAGARGFGGSAGSADGGAVYNLAFGNTIDAGAAVTASLALNNSILADDSNNGGADLASNAIDGAHTNAASITGTNNLVQTNDLANTTLGPSVIASSADPLLGGLADNGGPTHTIALTTASSAFNLGTTSVGLPATDQRGFARVVNGQVDAGAFQVQAGPPAVSSVLVIFSPNRQSATLTASVTSQGGPVNAGQVIFSILGLPGATAVADVVGGQASATFTLPAGLAAGRYTISASTDALRPSGLAGAGTLLVQPAGTTTKVIGVQHVGMFGLTEKVTVQVLDASGNPVSGPVTIHDGGLSQTVGLSGGQASAPFSPAWWQLLFELFLRHDVTASFLGTSNDLASGSGPFTVAALL